MEEVEGMSSGVRNQAALEQRVNKVVQSFVDLFDLGWVRIINKFDPRVDGDRVICETVPDWEYRQATFIWNLHQVASLPDEKLDTTVIHEIVHVLNAPLFESLTPATQEKLAKLNELSVENVCRVIEFILTKDS
jgi:predicted protein tyrosine phosphatase